MLFSMRVTWCDITVATKSTKTSFPGRSQTFPQSMTLHHMLQWVHTKKFLGRFNFAFQ